MKNLEQKANRKFDPKVKDVLKLLGAGTLLAAAFIMPGIGVVFKEYQKIQIEKDRKKWKKFNQWRLRYILKRLKKQKVVEMKDGLFKITNKGRQKLVKYNLEHISLQRKRDGKWRLIVYDIANLKKPQRELFRTLLKKMRFLQLQESVYLTPYLCENEIDYLKNVFDLSNDVQILKVSGIENERVYKDFFGI